MMGKQHREFSIPFGVMFASLLIGILGFGIEYALVVPLCWYFSVFPDIDQPGMAPKDTKRIKYLWETIMWLVPLAALVTLGYFGYRVYKGHDVMENVKEIGIAGGIVVLGFILNLTKKSKYTKFLWGHRGFTHTLIVPIGLLVLFNQLDNISNALDPKYSILIKASGVLIAGIFAGIVCHILLDLQCSAGVPILWPITKANIHTGNAITSDPRKQGKAHISSIIYTKAWSTICIIIAAIIIIKFNGTIIEKFQALISAIK